MHQARFRVYANMGLHAKEVLLAFAGLVHVRTALPILVLVEQGALIMVAPTIIAYLTVAFYLLH